MTILIPVSDPFVSTLTAGLCALGSYILTCSTEQFRLLKLGHHVSKVLSTKGLFALMSVSLGGVAIYSMNFLELAGIRIVIPLTDGTELAHIDFKTVPLGVSVIVALFLSFLGLYVASHDPMFAKTKKEIVESFIAGAKTMSLKEVKAISSNKIFWIISTQKLHYLVLGGFLTGIGAIVTACLTQWSLAIPDVMFIWDWGAMVGAAIFSCFVSILSFWILFRLLSLYPRQEILRIASVCVMAFGFIYTHYLAMDAFTIKAKIGMHADDSVQLTGKHHLDQEKGFYIILVSVIVFCFVLLVLTVVDLRSWLYESSHWLNKHEGMLLRLKGMHTDNFAIIAKYLREAELERSHHSSSHASHSPKKSRMSRGLNSKVSESAARAVSVVDDVECGDNYPSTMGRGNRVTPLGICASDCDDVTTSTSVQPTPRFFGGSSGRSSSVVPELTLKAGSAPAVGVESVAEEQMSSASTIRLPEEAKRDDDLEMGTLLLEA